MAVRFYPPGAPVPERLATGEFLLRPLTVDQVALDYAAVMESAAMLRRWSGSSWPSDDFSLDDNRADLAGHWAEHLAQEAFTYTVLDPAQTVCLGCVYIKPNTVAALDPTDDDALVRFWVRASLLESGLDGRLLAALRDWLAADFAFGRVFWHANADDAHQPALFQAAGLRRLIEATIPGRGGRYVFFA